MKTVIIEKLVYDINDIKNDIVLKRNVLNKWDYDNSFYYDELYNCYKEVKKFSENIISDVNYLDNVVQ